MGSLAVSRNDAVTDERHSASARYRGTALPARSMESVLTETENVCWFPLTEKLPGRI